MAVSIQGPSQIPEPQLLEDGKRQWELVVYCFLDAG